MNIQKPAVKDIPNFNIRIVKPLLAHLSRFGIKKSDILNVIKKPITANINPAIAAP